MQGLLVSKHRWEWEGQRLEQCQHTGRIWGLFVRLLLLLLWVWFGPVEYQAVCKNFCRLGACERWDGVNGAPMNREELHCSPKHPFSLWWSGAVMPNGSLPVAKSFISKPLLFHQDHLVLAQHILTPPWGCLLLSFLIKNPTFSLPCECQAVIPAPLPALGREGGARHSRLREPAREGEWAEPLGGEKGWKGAGRAPLHPVAGVFVELQSFM